jgi:hypothetical protein
VLAILLVEIQHITLPLLEKPSLNTTLPDTQNPRADTPLEGPIDPTNNQPYADDGVSPEDVK